VSPLTSRSHTRIGKMLAASSRSSGWLAPQRSRNRALFRLAERRIPRDQDSLAERGLHKPAVPTRFRIRQKYLEFARFWSKLYVDREDCRFPFGQPWILFPSVKIAPPKPCRPALSSTLSTDLSGRLSSGVALTEELLLILPAQWQCGEPRLKRFPESLDKLISVVTRASARLSIELSGARGLGRALENWRLWRLGAVSTNFSRRRDALVTTEINLSEPPAVAPPSITHTASRLGEGVARSRKG